uniref:G-protein coupled receptors family 1 profile domain-containing protein n=1 Tax=Callorhinchus milii TaxID=7868 RepID=A0A4W3GFG2_CALMI
KMKTASSSLSAPYKLQRSTSVTGHFYFSLSVANLASIVILFRGRCGLSKCVTRYLVTMSVADLMLVFTEVIFRRIIPYHFPNSFVFITHVCRLLFFMMATSTTTSVWFTVTFTFDRYVAVCCQPLKIKYCTEKSACIAIAVVNIFFIGENIPWYFAWTPAHTVNNMPWGCEFKIDFFTSRCWAALRGHKMRNRRKSIILLFAVSCSFILLWMTQVAFFLYWRISKTGNITDEPLVIFYETGNMLQLLSSCTNTCIYAVTQTKFREDAVHVGRTSQGAVQLGQDPSSGGNGQGEGREGRERGGGRESRAELKVKEKGLETGLEGGKGGSGEGTGDRVPEPRG